MKMSDMCACPLFLMFMCSHAQVRSFLELKEWLLSLELPEATRAAWEKFL
jgi:hypothetical protein